ncbi:MAG: radical SAM protein [Spirochaetia bacterium]|jgi:radical SAM protein with 4Fe4S-binding SPASM domain
MRFLRRANSQAQSAAPARESIKSLDWIDDFFQEIGSHIFAREEDGVVILPPNQVYKANATGIAIVRHMLAGGRAAGIPGIEREDRARQVAEFVSDIRALSLGQSTADGCLPYETVPYDFKYTTLPILGEIAVTYRCNNACIFCYAGCGTHTRGCGTITTGRAGTLHGAGAPHDAVTPRELSAGREMSLSEIKRVIGAFKQDAKIPFFSFTGGEPLLRGDLEEMIRFARRSGLEVNLITNGTLATARRAKSLYRAGLRTAQVSLESIDPETHDALTARPGSFQRTLAGMRSLQAAGVSVQTNTTITAANASDAPRLPAFLKGRGVSRFAMNLYLPCGTGGAETASTAAALFVSYSQAGAIVESVRAAARAEGMTFYWYSPLPHCHYNTIARGLGNKSCAAMDGLLSVSPAGDVLPCSSYPEAMGNLLSASFRDIWFSPRAGYFKRKEYAPAECTGCDSFTACQAACPLYWRYAGTAEIRNQNAAAREVAR